jgi:hypothetical protein
MVIGAALVSEGNPMKNIACIDGTVATKVRAVLARYGIMRGIYHMGPHAQDSTIRLVVSVAIDPEEEPAIRGEIESIAGTTIHD